MSDIDWPNPSQLQAKLIANRYQLGKLLGSDRFGQLYEAQDLKYEPPRAVAIKIVSADQSNYSVAVARLGHEANILAQINHPGVLQVLDYNVTTQPAYLVTEMATGGSLKDKVHIYNQQASKESPLVEVAHYLQFLAPAIDAIHAAGIVHGDIQPANIWLDANDRPLLANFGAAVVLNGQQSVGVDVVANGTELYAAPEMWRGSIRKASDIYALGITIYERLTGAPPYFGDTEGLKQQHTNGPVPSLTDKMSGDVPPELNGIMTAMLSKDVYNRPSSVGLIYQQFQEIADGRAPSMQPPVFETWQERLSYKVRKTTETPQFNLAVLKVFIAFMGVLFLFGFGALAFTLFKVHPLLGLGVVLFIGVTIAAIFAQYPQKP